MSLLDRFEMDALSMDAFPWGVSPPGAVPLAAWSLNDTRKLTPNRRLKTDPL